MNYNTLSFFHLRRSGLRWGIVLVGVLGLGILAVALLSDHFGQATVTVDVSGRVFSVHTRARTVGEALDDGGVLIDEEDVIQPGPETRLRDGMTISVHKAAAVAVEADGVVRQIRTQLIHPLDILYEQVIHVGYHDRVLVDGQDYSREQLEQQTWEKPPCSVRVVRSAALKITDGSRLLIIYTTQADVGRALDAAGIDLYLADVVVPDLSTPTENGLEVTILRSTPFTVEADGRRINTRARGPTVGDALAAIGLAPVGRDYTIPSLETPLGPNMLIRVVRVTESVITEQETIPFTTIYQPDPDLPLDELRVVQEGAEGQREWHIHVRYEDGLEVSRVVQDEWLVLPPTPRLIAYGLRIDVHQLDTPGGPVEYWRKLHLRVSAYSPSRSGADPGSPGYGLTSSGLPLDKGVVAVDPALIPLNHPVYVPEYGQAVTGDVRKDIRGRMIGLGYDDESWRPWFGWTDVYLLLPIPPADSIPYLLPTDE